MSSIVDLNKTGIFTAQYAGLKEFQGDFWKLAAKMAEIGYKHLQLTHGDFDLDRAAKDPAYCDEFKARLAALGLGISEISFHIPGQLMAVHPTYFEQYKAFLPEELQANATMKTMYEWGRDTTIKILQASKNFGLSTAVGFTGSLLWPYFYPWPQRPQALVEMGFEELAARWETVVRKAAELEVRLAFELHPGEDVHDGYTLEAFENALDPLVDTGYLCVNFDPSHFVLQNLDYLGFIDKYSDYIIAYHAKDAVLEPDGTMGVYGGYAPWDKRVGRFKTPGTGDVDFEKIAVRFEKYEIDVIAVVEWEDPEQDALQGATWAFNYLTTGGLPKEGIQPPAQAFDDFAATGADEKAIKHLIGLDQFMVG